MSDAGKHHKLGPEFRSALLREGEARRCADAAAPIVPLRDPAPRNSNDLATFREAHEQAVRLRVLLARHRGARGGILRALVSAAWRDKTKA
jgi:hypothetical protein